MQFFEAFSAAFWSFFSGAFWSFFCGRATTRERMPARRGFFLQLRKKGSNLFWIFSSNIALKVVQIFCRTISLLNLRLFQVARWSWQEGTGDLQQVDLMMIAMLIKMITMVMLMLLMMKIAFSTWVCSDVFSDQLSDFWVLSRVPSLKSALQRAL